MEMKSLCLALLCLPGIVAPTISVAADSPEEAANKQLVLDYYRDLETAATAGKFSELPGIDAKYRDPGYIQHSVTAGRAPAAPATGATPPGPNTAMPRMGAPKLLSIMAEGDKVIQVTSRTIPDRDGKPRETIIFNMFRVKNGKLIEHWDAFGVPSQPK